MNLLRRLRTLRSRQFDQDLEDELAAHLALKKQRLEAEGVEHEEAIRQARHALGNPAVWKENTRDAWAFGWLESLWRDIVFGLRILKKDRIFTIVALVTLALGIGANTAIFTLLNAILWRTLPVQQPDQLVRVRVTNLPPNQRAWVSGRATPPKERSQIPYALYGLLQERKDLFDGLFGMAGNGSMVLQVGETPVQVRTTTVTGSYFPVLGVEPRAGRLLTPDDDVSGGPPSGWNVVISDALWAKLFARRSDVVGARITIERTPFTIIGVAPGGFRGVHPGVETDVWIPLSAFETLFPKWRWRTDSDMWMLETWARLSPGISLDHAQGQLVSISQPLLEQIKAPHLKGESARHFLAMKLDLVSTRSGYSWLVESFGNALWILMAAVGAVLLIAATNLTNLLLARTTARRQEIAVRLAIGASAARVRRQLLVECALLVLGGTALGILFAQWLTSALLQGISVPAGLDTPLDWRVLGFIALVLSAVVLIAGWAPAWSAPRGAIYDASRQLAGSRRGMKLRGSLIVLQVACSLVLLAGAALLLTSLRAIFREATGFETAQSVFVTPDLFNAGISREDMPRVYVNLLDETRRQPNVTAAAWTLSIPLTGGLSAFTIEVPGHASLPPNERMAFSHQVTDGYFQAMSIHLRAGLDFPPRASDQRKTCIVSENLARKFFRSAEAAVGRRLKAGGDWTEIVGVAADAKYQHIREPQPLTVYTSYWDQRTTLGMALVVKHTGPREPLLAALREIFQHEAGRMPLMNVRTIDENIMASVATERLLAGLMSGFALFALLISATGIAGLLSYAVQLRRKEIGIRVALGATPSLIRREFQSHGLLLCTLGLILGGIVSFWMRRVIDAYLFRTESTDPLIWAAVCCMILLCGLVASAIPAWKAARLDPISALRLE